MELSSPLHKLTASEEQNYFSLKNETQFSIILSKGDTQNRVQIRLSDLFEAFCWIFGANVVLNHDTFKIRYKYRKVLLHRNKILSILTSSLQNKSLFNIEMLSFILDFLHLSIMVICLINERLLIKKKLNLGIWMRKKVIIIIIISCCLLMEKLVSWLLIN